MTQLLRRIGRQARRFVDTRRYQLTGRKPWTPGYRTYHRYYIESVLHTPRNLAHFADAKPLPRRYGIGLDERVIEYPWVFARLNREAGYLLDAGSTLNKAFILDLEPLHNKRVVIVTLAPEGTLGRHNVSYFYGDLRKTILADEVFEEIVCISTLEHVGMDNTRLYTSDNAFSEKDADAYQLVLQELRRLLRPGGQVLLTVPFGRHENHGWLQQFDYEMVSDVLKVFDRDASSVTIYRYFADGWRLSTPEECADCTYFDVHAAAPYRSSRQAAAEAVACMQLVK